MGATKSWTGWTAVLLGAVIVVTIAQFFLMGSNTEDMYDYASVPSWPVYTFKMLLSNALRKAADALVPPANRLLSSAFDLNQLIAMYCCGKIGWPDVMSEGPQTGRFLARHANMSKIMTRRLMRACVAADLFHEIRRTNSDADDDDRLYVNTPMGDALRERHPFTMKHFVQMHVEDMAPGLMQFWHALRDDGVRPFSLAHKYPHFPGAFWQYFEDHPAQALQFNKAMIGVDALGNAALVHDFPWGTACSSIVDVGSGRGSFLAQVLRKYPSLRGTMLDAPYIVDQAEAYWAETHADLLPRAAFARGDFFDPAAIPRGAGRGACYVIKVVLHDWDDERAEAILRGVAGRMGEGDRLLVLEFIQVVPETVRDRPFWDLEMRVFGGRERSVADFRRLFAAAGLTVRRVRATRSLYTIVEGARAANETK